jgi:hypothetical protein
MAFSDFDMQSHNKRDVDHALLMVRMDVISRARVFRMSPAANREREVNSIIGEPAGKWSIGMMVAIR